MTETAIALIDCNSFYCSCERVFRPDLNGKPIVLRTETRFVDMWQSDWASNNRDFVKKQFVAVYQAVECLLVGDHVGNQANSVRKFCSMAWPCSVRMDSG